MRHILAAILLVTSVAPSWSQSDTTVEWAYGYCRYHETGGFMGSGRVFFETHVANTLSSYIDQGIRFWTFYAPERGHSGYWDCPVRLDVTSNPESPGVVW